MVEEKGGKAEVADARGDTGDALCSTRGDIFTQKTKYVHVGNATIGALKLTSYWYNIHAIANAHIRLFLLVDTSSCALALISH